MAIGDDSFHHWEWAFHLFKDPATSGWEAFSDPKAWYQWNKMVVELHILWPKPCGKPQAIQSDCICRTRSCRHFSRTRTVAKSESVVFEKEIKTRCFGYAFGWRHGCSELNARIFRKKTLENSLDSWHRGKLHKLDVILSYNLLTTLKLQWQHNHSEHLSTNHFFHRCTIAPHSNESPFRQETPARADETIGTRLWTPRSLKCNHLIIWLINISLSALRIVTMDVILGLFSSSGGDSLSMGNWERTNSPCCTPHFNKAGLGSCWIIIGGYMTQHFQRRDWHSSHSGWNFLSWHETCAGFSVQKEPQPAVWG